MSYLKSLENPRAHITAIDNGLTFPEKMEFTLKKYKKTIDLFSVLVQKSSSTEELLGKVRSSTHDASTRMSLLKIFRRCACLICDTETTKKITKVTTNELIEAFGEHFKPIDVLQSNFSAMPKDQKAALAMLIGEYDDRGKQGYVLTDMFFNWFEESFSDWSIEGPRGAGRDIELSSVLKDFDDKCPCDFVIKDPDGNVKAVGFARYDSTRGGAQSDDRTGGNADKVNKLQKYFDKTGNIIKLVFLSDGPGLVHKDTWEEACNLDGSWNDNVRVTTYSLTDERITKNWLI